MISLISSFEIINVGIPDPKILLWVAASVADAAASNLKGTKTLLDNGWSMFFIKGNLDFSTGPKSQPKNLPYCPTLCNSVFDNFIFTDDLFTKALRHFETFVLANDNLWRKLFFH